MTPNDTKPAEMVNIDIMASPDSYVGLVAVDQSTKLLTSGDRKAGFTIDDVSYYPQFRANHYLTVKICKE